jgi:hypothetical protein
MRIQIGNGHSFLHCQSDHCLGSVLYCPVPHIKGVTWDLHDSGYPSFVSKAGTVRCRSCLSLVSTLLWPQRRVRKREVRTAFFKSFLSLLMQELFIAAIRRLTHVRAQCMNHNKFYIIALDLLLAGEHHTCLGSTCHNCRASKTRMLGCR